VTHVTENDTGPDDCNHAQFGAFVLAAPYCTLSGELSQAYLLDIAPTLLELGGYDVPDSMQGQGLAGKQMQHLAGGALSLEAEAMVYERLAGLGYI
jgi:predicted AlkP superfamily phosphohydrolase/phosphomutase